MWLNWEWEDWDAPRKCASNPYINCVCWNSGVCQWHKLFSKNEEEKCKKQ